jgi:hypothetical protein
MEERRNEQNSFFGEEIIGTNVTNPIRVLGSCLGKDVGFRDENDDDYNNFLWHSIYVSNNQTYCKLAGNKHW